MKPYSNALGLLPLLLVVAMAGCARQPSPVGGELPGFWMGLVHGLLILVSFIGGLFADVRIYAFPNAGGWYDFGYLVGVMLILGGGTGARRGRRKRPRSDDDDDTDAHLEDDED